MESQNCESSTAKLAIDDYMRIVFFKLLELTTTPVDFRICQDRTYELPDIHTAHLLKNFPTPATLLLRVRSVPPALARPQASGAGRPPQAAEGNPQGLARKNSPVGNNPTMVRLQQHWQRIERCQCGLSQRVSLRLYQFL
jgi:hypothetical protein